MTVRNLLIFNAVWAMLNAMVAIFFPATSLDLYGFETTDAALALVRAAGAGSVGYAITSWLMRNAGPSGARRAFLLGGGLGYVVVALVAAYIGLTLVSTAMVWGGALIIAILGAIFIYMGLQEGAA